MALGCALPVFPASVFVSTAVQLWKPRLTTLNTTRYDIPHRETVSIFTYASAVQAVVVCLSVPLSLTSRYFIETMD